MAVVNPRNVHNFAHGERARPDDPLRLKKRPIIATQVKVNARIDAQRMLSAAASQAATTVKLMTKLAHNAGKLLRAAGREADPATRQKLLSRAYDERTGAELAKYAAAYAEEARTRATQALQLVASDIPKSKDYQKDAHSLLQASEQALSSRKSIPQPAVLRFAKVTGGGTQELTMLGVEKTATGGAFSTKKVGSLFPNMPMYWPDDVEAAGALHGTEQAQSPDFMANVMQAFGIGIAAAGSAAEKAGKEQTRDNPRAGSFVEQAGSLLNRLGVQMSGAQQRGETGAALPGSTDVPWLYIGGAVLGAGVLYLVFKK